MRSFIVLFSIFILVSCDCYRSYQGVVIDAETNEPIGGVEIYSSASRKYLNTTSLEDGSYSGNIVSGMRQCFKPHYFLFTKEGYRDTLAVDSGKLLMFKLGDQE
ncbi:MAG: hypothetical protein H6600_06810 [Flavobacteriales bacterium]|nr:hypothetical protein [Flavobacteriales bacterium]MCB9198150.1 hypothetical protein [Flavobacteriales bacterium]